METRLQQKCELLISYGITTKNVLTLLTMAEEYSLKVSICVHNDNLTIFVIHVCSKQKTELCR